MSASFSRSQKQSTIIMLPAPKRQKLSSDDEHDPEPTPRRHLRTARKGKGRAFHVAEEDVIDVSDSSDKKTSGQSRGSHKPSRKAKETKEVRACAASRRAS